MYKVNSRLMLFALATLFQFTSCEVSADNKSIAWHSFEESKYAILINVKPIIDDAVKICSDLEAHVVHINSRAENEFLRQLAFSKPLPDMRDGDQFWIGADDREMEGLFVWQDNGTQMWPEQQAGFTNWGKTSKGSQPNNFFKNGEDEDCVVLRKDGSWYDIGCTSRFSFLICEK